QGLVREEGGRGFDLKRGPLWRAKLLKLSPQEHIILLTMHHIVSDGWSMGVLIKEVGSLYGAYSGRRPSPLRELEVQYVDYALWQREWLSGPVLEGHLEYWRGRLKGSLPALELPTDRPRPRIRSHQGASESFRLGKELQAVQRRLGRQNGATLYMTLLSGFKVLLSRYSGQSEIIVGSPIAGRAQAGLEEMIGFFVNTLVLRTDLSGAPSFEELLRRVRETTLGAYTHQDA